MSSLVPLESSWRVLQVFVVFVLDSVFTEQLVDSLIATNMLSNRGQLHVIKLLSNQIFRIRLKKSESLSVKISAVLTHESPIHYQTMGGNSCFAVDTELIVGVFKSLLQVVIHCFRFVKLWGLESLDEDNFWDFYQVILAFFFCWVVNDIVLWHWLIKFFSGCLGLLG